MSNPNPWRAQQRSIEVRQKVLKHPETHEVGNISYWAAKIGIGHGGMRYRLKTMPLLDALSTPAQANARNSMAGYKAPQSQ